jgi:Mn2+/Fe2+ NRAMP family transporter
MQFYLQSSIAEKGIKKEQYRASRLDVIIGCSITDIISFFVIVTCGTLLFPHGIRINEASEAALALKPLAGEYAYLVFAVSLANASLLGAIIVPLATAYYVCEAMGWEAGVNKTFNEAPQFMWIYTLIIALASLVIMIPGAPLVFLMVLSAVINGLPYRLSDLCPCPGEQQETHARINEPEGVQLHHMGDGRYDHSADIISCRYNLYPAQGIAYEASGPIFGV